MNIEIQNEAQALINAWSWKDKIAYLGHTMAEMPQTECPLNHHFAPGIYIREIVMASDTYIIGKIHKTEHFNILTKGSCLLIDEDGTTHQLKAGDIFISQQGVQKLLYIQQETIWLTVHASEEKDIDKLEESLAQPIPDDPMIAVMKVLEKLT